MDPSRAIAKLEQVNRLLAECKTMPQAKHYRDMGEAARLFARMNGLGLEAQNNAAEFKLRSERRLGEMLKQMELRAGRPGKKNATGTSSISQLKALGISQNQSSHWQQLAAVPARRFEGYLAHARAGEEEITTAGVLRSADPNYKHDARANRGGDSDTPKSYDNMQTPGYALEPLLHFVLPTWIIWEPAAGEGLLVDRLYDEGFREHQVIDTDVLTGRNFFDWQPGEWDVIITNPPYSIKYLWLKRCYELGQPFALLMPVEVLGAKAAQELFAEHGVEVIFMDQRINFKMPVAGWTGSGAQFPVAWFTWQFNVGAQMFFAQLEKEN